MRVLRFQCPLTERSIQCMDCEGEEQHSRMPLYQAVLCPACTGLHFVNLSTGELLRDS